MTTHKHPYWVIFIPVLMLGGCHFRSGDPFYTRAGGWDYDRLPLIKPVAAISARTGLWSFEYPPDFKISSNHIVGSIQQLNVKNGIIYGYASGYTITDSHGSRTEIHYFLISPMDNSRSFYTFNKSEYVDKLKESNLDPDSVYEVNELFQEFTRTGKLRWYQPDSANRKGNFF